MCHAGSDIRAHHVIIAAIVGLIVGGAVCLVVLYIVCKSRLRCFEDANKNPDKKQKFGSARFSSKPNFYSDPRECMTIDPDGKAIEENCYNSLLRFETVSDATSKRKAMVRLDSTSMRTNLNLDVG